MTTTLPPLTEAQVQQQILDYLRMRGHIAIRVNSGKVLADNKDGSKRMIKLADKGTSDIIGCANNGTGQFYAIETKKVGEKPTSDQEVFMQDVRDRGGLAFPAWCVDDVIEKGL